MNVLIDSSKRFSPLQSVQNGSAVHTVSYSMCTTILSGQGWGVKGLCHGVDGLPPSSAKFKNKWMYTSTPPICPNGVYRDNFIVQLCLYTVCVSHIWTLCTYIQFTWYTVLSKLGNGFVPWVNFWFSFFCVNRITCETVSTAYCTFMWQMALKW